jgi:hypothetical protein
MNDKPTRDPKFVQITTSVTRSGERAETLQHEPMARRARIGILRVLRASLRWLVGQSRHWEASARPRAASFESGESWSARWNAALASPRRPTFR